MLNFFEIPLIAMPKAPFGRASTGPSFYHVFIIHVLFIEALFLS